jgi:hypothetical protein
MKRTEPVRMHRGARSDKGESWAEFWARVPADQRCPCSGSRCGLMLNACPGCGSRNLAVRVLSKRPVLELICTGCESLIEVFRVEDRTS